MKKRFTHNFWLVDFNGNEKLIENLFGWATELFSEEIQSKLKNTFETFVEDFKNRVVINDYKDKWFTTGDVKFTQGLWWLRGYPMIKDFNIVGRYEKVYLKDYVKTHTQMIPIDALK